MWGTATVSNSCTKLIFVDHGSWLFKVLGNFQFLGKFESVKYKSYEMDFSYYLLKFTYLLLTFRSQKKINTVQVEEDKLRDFFGMFRLHPLAVDPGLGQTYLLYFS